MDAVQTEKKPVIEDIKDFRIIYYEGVPVLVEREELRVRQASVNEDGMLEGLNKLNERCGYECF